MVEDTIGGSDQEDIIEVDTIPMDLMLYLQFIITVEEVVDHVLVPVHVLVLVVVEQDVLEKISMIKS